MEPNTKQSIAMVSGSLCLPGWLSAATCTFVLILLLLSLSLHLCPSVFSLSGRSSSWAPRPWPTKEGASAQCVCLFPTRWGSLEPRPFPHAVYSSPGVWHLIKSVHCFDSRVCAWVRSVSPDRWLVRFVELFRLPLRRLSFLRDRETRSGTEITGSTKMLRPTSRAFPSAHQVR